MAASLDAKIKTNNKKQQNLTTLLRKFYIYGITTTYKREQIRESAFSTVWSEQLNDAFKNIAPYYDRGNQVASLGC